MPKIEASTVERYQNILEKDPTSQVFAPLAEAYREMGMLAEASKVAAAGVFRHPQFTSGLVTYARILRDLQQNEKAFEVANRATELATDNILAHQIKAEILLNLKKPKEALKAFKMVLFLNPHSKSAQKAVQKLESLTADEYEDDVFSMTKLPDVVLRESANLPPPPKRDFAFEESPIVQNVTPSINIKALDRMLSLIDAFIVRNDLEKANALLKDTRIEFGDHPEIQKRMKTLQVRYDDLDEPLPLKPLRPRDELVRQKQLETLELMLRKIEHYRAHS